jgi:hypothetical protein
MNVGAEAIPTRTRCRVWQAGLDHDHVGTIVEVE